MKDTSVYSDVFSTTYIEHILTTSATNPTWADQVEINKSEGLALSYTISKIGESNMANRVVASEIILEPHDRVINNTCESQGLRSLAISYLINQPTDPQL